MIEIRKGAIKVKNAVLAQTKDFNYIVHYDTIIFKMNKRTEEISIFKPVSLSSQNAINEGLEYLGYDYFQIQHMYSELVEKLNGLTKTELWKMWKFKRYEQPERKRQSEILETVTELISQEEYEQ